MKWQKTRISLNVFAAGDFKITENPEEPADRRFRLECFSEDSEPEFFGSLRQAQHAAALREELAQLRADNEQLRMALDDRAGRWPDDDDRAPTERPEVAALAGELLQLMAHNDETN